MLTKLKDLKEGDWFTELNSEFKNSYQLISNEAIPGISVVECNGKLIEMGRTTEVTKIDGFHLYLLQGGK